ncbi:hypothetical protein [Pseudoalteromonas rubra]|uniref:hypothetical protein n=1 Tax=Pseudoalteromonas rubra TaxID=43658 RepID=UPI000F76CF63|nr:hypothetical protein [Pseudoalteromonas rubra]
MQSKSKKNLIRLFDKFNPVFYGAILYIFKVVNIFRGKQRVLIFTDSRGAEITNPILRKNPFSSYIGYFVRNYACDVHLCEEKYTSLIDFLSLYRSVDANEYSFIVLHCGIVDFAPRPLNSYLDMLNSKRSKISTLGWSDEAFEVENREPGTQYEGQNTYSFLPKAFFEEKILKELIGIPKLIYIGVNPVLHDWIGCYWRARPDNINEQLSYDKVLLDSLNFTVPLAGWKPEEIRKFTVDNVHYNKVGFDYILRETKLLVDKVEDD